MTVRLSLFVISAIFAAKSFAAEPVIGFLSPRSLVPGKTNVVKITGKLAPKDEEPRLWTSFPCDISIEYPNEKRKSSEVRATIVPQAGLTGYGAVRVYSREGVGIPCLIRFDEGSKGFDFTVAEGKAHLHKFEAKQGQHLEFELFAQRLHSAMDGVMTLLDAQDNELAFADDSEQIGTDPVLRYQFQQDGEYRLKIHDVQWRGGIHGHLRISEWKTPAEESAACNAEESKDPTLVEVPHQVISRFDEPGDSDTYRTQLQAGEYLTVTPTGTALALLDLKLDGRRLKRAGTGDSDNEPLRFHAAKDGEYELTVRELLGRGDIPYTLDLRTDIAPFAAQVIANGRKNDRNTGKPGSKVEVKIRCTRFGYDGPIEIKAFGSKGEYKVEKGKFAEKKTVESVFVVLPKELPENELEVLQLKAVCKIGDQEFAAKVGTGELARKKYKHISHYPDWLDGQVLVGVHPKSKAKKK